MRPRPISPGSFPEARTIRGRRRTQSHPWGALWDDGADAVNELAHVREVRRLALRRFGPANLPKVGRRCPAALAQERNRPFFVDQMATAILGRGRSSADSEMTSCGVRAGSSANSLAARLTTFGDAIEVPESLSLIPPGTKLST